MPVNYTKLTFALSLLLSFAGSIETEDHTRVVGEICDPKPNVFITPTEAGSCTVDEDCSKYPFYECNDDSICEHKGIFP